MFRLEGLLLAVVQDVLLRDHHVNAQGQGEEYRGCVPVFDRLTRGGDGDDGGGYEHHDEAHEPLFSHFHCPRLLPKASS
jgi:hypothetical protein